MFFFPCSSPSAFSASSRRSISPKCEYNGCCLIMNLASGFSLSKSSETASHMVTNPSHPFRKYLVNGVSKNRGSCGTTLSKTPITLQCFPTCLATNPREGAKYDIQYLMIRTSGFHSLILRAALIHENGLAVSKTAVLSIGAASSSGVTYCVFPGKRKFGYCLVKLNACTISDLPSSVYKAALNWAIPPLKG